METKRCSKCGEIKSIDKFHKNKECKYGVSNQCKKCKNEYAEGYNKEYYKKHFEKVLAQQKIYRQDNSEKVKKAVNQWHEDNPEKVREIQKKHYENNIEKIKLASKIWAGNNPEKRKKIKKKWEDNNLKYASNWMKNKRKKDLAFRLNGNISSAIRKSLKGNKNSKHCEDILGYSIFEKLIPHLESQFKSGMTRNNYGKGGWEIDHIKPKDSFNFASYNDPEFKECWALSNLQPLWRWENRSKGNKWIK